jgi:acid ceramidase/N-acylethanolamine-hydrolysing acid amidase
MQAMEYIVDLDKPVDERWDFLAGYTEEINALIGCYLRDFDGSEYLFDSIDLYKIDVISSQYLEEIQYVASISEFNENEILIANLYYDVLKFYFGCTAFAVDNGQTTFHCRNLDWHTDENLLSKYSMVFDFRKNGKTLYKTVGWPGFIGALSGIRPNAFSVTLNAVLSKDSPEIAFPISFLIRDVLESCESYKEAKEKLERTPIASDCLILLSGTQAGEKIVIERTPKRVASRESISSFIVVTNDYKKLENGTSTNELQATSCVRHDRTMELLNKAIPESTDQCLEILADKKVMMRITVQQMVFNNKTGEITLIKT